jgi:hypothetical protein
MTNANRNKEYLAKEKKECHYCRHKGRDVRPRMTENNELLSKGFEMCNNCFVDRKSRQ